MELPQDLKNFDGAEYEDAFQLFPAYSVGWVLLGIVALAAIFEPLVR